MSILVLQSLNNVVSVEKASSSFLLDGGETRKIISSRSLINKYTINCTTWES